MKLFGYHTKFTAASYLIIAQTHDILELSDAEQVKVYFWRW